MLLEYKLHRRFVLDKPDSALRFNERLFADYRAQQTDPQQGFLPLEKVLEDLSEAPDDWVPHPTVQRVVRQLEHGRGALIVGFSSSGKSVLAFQCGRARALAGKRVLYLNLGTIGIGSVRPLSTFLGNGGGAPELIIADDLQSNPGFAKYVLALSNLFRRSAVSPPAVLATAWPDFAPEASTWHEYTLPLTVQPSIVRDSLLKQYGDGLSAEILRGISTKFGDDLLLLRLALQQAQSMGSGPLLSNVAESLWKQRTDGSGVQEAVAKRIALVASSLGRYDILTPEPFLIHEARVDEPTVRRLVASKLLRRTGQQLSIGHRSLCALLCDWLNSIHAWQLLDGSQRDSRSVVLDYLKSLGSGLTVDSLRSLHEKAGLKDQPRLNRRALAVLEVWRAFDAIVERIEEQQEKDPSWNAVPSSAMFAVQALGEVGKPDLALNSLRFLRNHWTLDRDQTLTLTLAGLTTRVDFEGIRAAMLAEDDSSLAKEAGWEAATKIDFNLFHQTWLAGLVLCAEAAGQQPIVSLTLLAEAVEHLQRNSGGFYPERVPWCTARVLLGLASCGRTIHTSRVVREAAEWLLRSHNDGGAFRDGFWMSGTGTWNTTLETTGMVLLALAAIGFDMSDPRLDQARSFLMSEKPRWTAVGSELAGALAIQAYLETGGAWDEVVMEAHRLSQWAKGTAFWEGATASDKDQFEQTCKVAQIAWHLVAIGWVAIKSDLPAFLDALSTPQQFDEGLEMFVPAAAAATQPEKPQTATLATATSDDFVLLGLKTLRELSLSESVVVGAYMRNDERVRNRLRDWCTRMSAPLVAAPSDVHENFLVWAAPGSGKSYLVQQLAASLAPGVRYLELNLALMARRELHAGLESLTTDHRPILCLVDEIDARDDEAWPYDEIFSFLDLNRQPDHKVVFVLVGSRGDGREGMVTKMRQRPKGRDLLDRIPADRQFEIPPTTLYDKAIIVAAQVLAAGRQRGVGVRQIEKMLFYYVLSNETLNSPRQLSNLARDAVSRMSIKEDRLRYDNLFETGDSRNQRFFANHIGAANELENLFVQIRE